MPAKSTERYVHSMEVGVSQRIVIALLLTFAATDVCAQVGRSSRVSGGPEYWVGLSYGYMDGTTINDGDTNGLWQFGYTSQIRATFEKTLQRGVWGGISAGFANAPLTYTSPALNNPCGLSCPATADITQYMAFIQGGTGVGFHGLYNVEAGFTRFSNFREKSSDTQLPPTDAKS